VQLYIAFNGHQRYSEGTRNLGLSRSAIDHQLAGLHPKGRQIAFVMDEDRQMTVKVANLAVLTLECYLRANVSNPFRKNRQLHLWHPLQLPKSVQKITLPRSENPKKNGSSGFPAAATLQGADQRF
jgi:hypothetical protein